MNKISETQRIANSKAVERRNKWRRDYRMISESLRHCKLARNLAYSVGESDHAVRLTLVIKSLQETADIMMEERWVISEELKNTSYQYV